VADQQRADEQQADEQRAEREPGSGEQAGVPGSAGNADDPNAAVDPAALAVDAAPDELRVGSDAQDETSMVQLNPGEVAAVDDSEESSAPVFPGGTTPPGEESPIDPAGDLGEPDGAGVDSVGRGADGSEKARLEQKREGGP
jgi:hypothetical protein